MAMKHCATYLRVSTQRQGSQGLGISAQRSMCENFIRQNKYEHTKEFMDVESGTHRNRKGLWQAIEYCRANGCSLVIAKLDRLARDVEFTFKVINTGIDIHFTDMPIVNSMVLGVFAAVAQYEREMCSIRTKQALEVKKKQGAQLGASNEKYKESYYKHTEEERHQFGMKRGQLKRERFQERGDFQQFKRIIHVVFPEHTESDDIMEWEWSGITTRSTNCEKMLEKINDCKAVDPSLFRKFDGTSRDTARLRAMLYTFKRSLGLVK